MSLSGGEAYTAEEFQVLGQLLDGRKPGCGQVAVRKATALGGPMGEQKAGPRCERKVYNTLVLPHLEYAAEAWNSTAAQMHGLEAVHNGWLCVGWSTGKTTSCALVCILSAPTWPGHRTCSRAGPLMLGRW